MSTLDNPRRKLRKGVPSPNRRRALELIAWSPDGMPETMLLEHGFTVDMLVDLIRAGLASATTERVVVGRRPMEVTRVRITDAGRRSLAEQARALP